MAETARVLVVTVIMVKIKMTTKMLMKISKFIMVNSNKSINNDYKNFNLRRGIPAVFKL